MEGQSRTLRLKRLTNNRTGVRQRRLAKKSTIRRKLSKMSITYRKREKTPMHTSEQQRKADLLSEKLANKFRIMGHRFGNLYRGMFVEMPFSVHP